MQVTSRSSLSLLTLVMLIVGAIDSIRNLPATALFGTTLVFFFIFSAIVFLIPTGLISAELAAAFPEKGGIYQWIKKAFGDRFAFFAIWLQWINTLVWYPTILSFIAGTIAYLINPALANNKLYLVSVILTTFWGLTLLNFKGITTSAKFASFCALIGLVIPMTLIIGLLAVWLFKGLPLQIHFTAHDIFPSMHQSESWISLTAIMTAFLGMEISAVHINHVRDPQRTFPKALFYSTAIILVTMILGSLAIAMVLPKSQINLVDGIMVAFTNYFQVYHLQWLIPVLTVMLLIGSLGGIINWVISPAKGLLHAAEDGFLPEFLTKQNEAGVPTTLLLLQAVIVTIVCLAFLLMPSINGSYWLLTDLSTQLYMIMYVVLFAAAIVLRYKFNFSNNTFKIPGGKFGMWTVCVLGLIGSFITLVVGFFPPDNINVGGELHYEIIFSSGIVAMIIPIAGFYFYRRTTRTKLVEIAT